MSDEVLAEIRSMLPDLMYRDRAAVEQDLRKLERRRAAGQPVDRIRDRAFLRAEASRAEVRRRRASPLGTRLAPDLPISDCAEDIEAAIRAHSVTVVCGETGSGKTTQLPKLLARMGYGTRGRIGHTQPRRIAARSVALRIAEELSVRPGEDVGYQVRFDRRTSERSRIKLMTDGILLAETQDDPDLLQYDALIIDEAHERSLNIDFLLGYLHRLVARRPELKLIITSATIDPERFSRHFADAPIITASGRTWPVEIRYRPPPEDLEEAPALADQVVETMRDIRSEESGDVLVFLPTERDIRETRGALEEAFGSALDLVPLYARLPVADQQRIFAPHDKQRVVLATNVAETSLTVPGIRYVVDSGLARISRFSTRTQVQRLPIEAVSQASARQRAGRAGRIEAGVCIRLYSEKDHDQRDEFTAPEILRTHLASVILTMKSLDLGEPEHFPFVDPPEPRRIRAGYETLFELGAVDEHGDLTEIGHDIALLPIDPRLGRMLVAAHHANCLTEMTVLAAVLSIQDPRERPHEERAQADQAHLAFTAPDSDYLSLLKLWRAFQDRRRTLSHRKLRAWCKEHFLSHARMREWQDLHGQLCDQLDEAGIQQNEQPAPKDLIHRALLSGLLGNIGHRQTAWAYRGARGGRFWLWPGSGLAGNPPKWVLCAEHLETNRRYGRLVAPIEAAWIEPFASHLLRRSYVDPYWHVVRGHVYAYENAHLYDLEVVHRKRVSYEQIDPVRSREIFIRQALVHGEIKTRAPFHRHNRELTDILVERLGRSRSMDLLCSADDLFAWYDERIPASVANTRALERWYREESQRDPRLLHLSEDDLLLHPEELPEARLFPGRMSFGGEELELEWTYEPGSERDGVAVRVSRDGLMRLDPNSIDWIVPGLLEEKVADLLKSLPKATRRTLVPLPDTARSVVRSLNFREGPFLESVVRSIRGSHAVAIRVRDFHPERLAPHLRMAIRVVDAAGQEIAFGRDLFQLRRELAGEAAAPAMQNLARSPQRSDDVHTSWSFGELPEQEEREIDGLWMRTWPALRDVGRGARLVYLDTPEQSVPVHAAGVRRLLALRHKKEILRDLDRRKDATRLRLAAACLPIPEEFETGVIARVVHHALEGVAAWPRCQADFDGLATQLRSRLATATREVLDTTARLLEGYEATARKLQIDAPPLVQPAIRDMTEQLALLLGRGFWIETPPVWFRRMPRYVDAIDKRLVRLGQGGLAKDTQRMQVLQPHLRRWIERRELLGAQGLHDDELTTYRWMLEEFRVSLFAQELKTAIPISVKRLEKQWERVRFG